MSIVTTPFSTPKKILIIEDETEVAEIVITYLNKHGYNPFHSQWGVKGLKLAENEKPDLIILDIGLPDISGWGVLDEIKKRGIRTRVVIFTILSDAESIIKFVRAGACDYIIKSLFREEFDFEKFRMKIERALELENTINPNLMYVLPPEIEKAILELGHGGNLLLSHVDSPKKQQNVLKSKEYQHLLRENEQLTKSLKSEQKKQNELKTQLLKFERLSSIQNFGFRVFYIILSSLITWFFFQSKLLTDSKLIFLLPLILFVLLLFPVERIQQISAKYSTTEAQVNLRDDTKSDSE